MTEMIRMIAECTVTMSVVGALLMAVTPLLTKRYSARSIYIAWMIVLVGFLIPFRPQIATPAVSVTVPEIRQTTQEDLFLPAQVRLTKPQTTAQRPSQAAVQMAVNTAVNTAKVDYAIPVMTEQARAEAKEKPAETARPSLTAVEIVFVVWILGITVVLGHRLAGHFRFMRTVRRWSKPVQEPAYKAVLASAKQEMGIDAHVTLRICAPLDSPMLVGLLSPTILLPDSTLSLAEADLVFRHELNHFKGRDLWGRVLMLLASALHWFNPLLIVFMKAATFQCEASCDAKVMQGMDMDARLYYSETIIHSLRGRPALSTALSTRYRGGMKTMKRRILQILDDGRKKLGALVVCTILVAVLGTGMAFALNTPDAPEGKPGETASAGASQSPEPTVAPTPVFAAVDDATEELGEAEERRLLELNTKLLGLLDGYNKGFPMDGQLLIYDFYPEAAAERKYESLMAQMDACETGIDLTRFLKDEQVRVRPIPKGVTEWTYKMLGAAGFLGWDDIYFRAFRPQIGENEWIDAYRVTVDDPELDGATTVEVVGEDRLLSMQNGFSPYEGKLTRIAPDEKETMRARAVEFCVEYADAMLGEDVISMVSDWIFSEDGEIMTGYVWVFDTRRDWSGYGQYRTGHMPYSAEDHSQNVGFLVQIEQGSGRILGFTSEVDEATFVNGADASTDWTYLTGEAFPIVDTNYMWETVAPIANDKLYELGELYYADLSIEGRTAYRHMAGNMQMLLGPDGEWERFLNALGKCKSAKDFDAVLLGDFIGITQSPEGEPQREDILAYADGLLDAIGYGDFVLRSFTYSGYYGEMAGAPAYEVFATGLDVEEDPYSYRPLPEHVKLTITADGKLSYVDGGEYWTDETAFTQAEWDEIRGPIEETARTRVSQILTETLMSGLDIRLDEMMIGETAYQAHSGESRILRISVPYSYEGIADGETAVLDDGRILLIYNIEDGRLCGMQYADADSDAWFLQPSDYANIG